MILVMLLNYNLVIMSLQVTDIYALSCVIDWGGPQNPT